MADHDSPSAHLRRLPGFDPEVYAFVEKLERHLVDSWRPLGLVQRLGNTWVEYWLGDRRICIAPHKSYASVYFSDPRFTHAYREIGGRYTSGKYTINVPFGDLRDLERLQVMVHLALEGSAGIDSGNADEPR